MLVGLTLAATNAYFLSRGVGRTFAQRVIDAEMSNTEGDDGNVISRKLTDISQIIDQGTVAQ